MPPLPPLNIPPPDSCVWWPRSEVAYLSFVAKSLVLPFPDQTAFQSFNLNDYDLAFLEISWEQRYRTLKKNRRKLSRQVLCFIPTELKTVVRGARQRFTGTVVLGDLGVATISAANRMPFTVTSAPVRQKISLKQENHLFNPHAVVLLGRSYRCIHGWKSVSCHCPEGMFEFFVGCIIFWMLSIFQIFSHYNCSSMMASSVSIFGQNPTLHYFKDFRKITNVLGKIPQGPSVMRGEPAGHPHLCGALPVFSLLTSKLCTDVCATRMSWKLTP